MEPDYNLFKDLQEKTATKCFPIQPADIDDLKKLARKALLVKTADDEKIGSHIPLDFIIVLGPQYSQAGHSVERENLVLHYLNFFKNHPDLKLKGLPTKELLELIINYKYMEKYVLLSVHSSTELA